jgi:pimeloyl-ACP methyl ester carboxylesterase
LHKDEYTEIVKVFGPAFVTEFSRRAKEPGGSYLRDATIYSTGHSLGGGLAQQFAYSLPTGPGMQRVAQVYAFDPSPVTGFYSVDSRTRDINKNGLLIDRIYERGEILAIARSLTSSIYPPSAKNPSVRAVRYSLFYPANPISGHSMAELACKLQVAAGHGNGP